MIKLNGRVDCIMSKSSLWVMDKTYKGYEVLAFQNSWLFSPVVWGVLSDKYIPEKLSIPYGYKKSLISDLSLLKPLNNKINDCVCTPDRICWEMSNQQVFFTKDKEIIAENIIKFLDLNKEYDKTSDGNYPLKAEHIIKRFNEIADGILNINENEYPYIIFKNTSVDDNVQRWFNKYDKSEDMCIKSSLNEIDKIVTEFVFIEDGEIIKFVNNIDYFK